MAIQSGSSIQRVFLTFGEELDVIFLNGYHVSIAVYTSSIYTEQDTHILPKKRPKPVDRRV